MTRDNRLSLQHIGPGVPMSLRSITVPSSTPSEENDQNYRVLGSERKIWPRPSVVIAQGPSKEPRAVSVIAQSFSDVFTFFCKYSLIARIDNQLLIVL